jgi:Spy/CpxP family protein refolding chaperone
MKTRKLRLKGMVLAMFLSVLTVAAFTQTQSGKCIKASQQTGCQRAIPDLTDEQEAAISKLKVEHLNVMTTYKAELGVLKAELNKLEITDPIDQKAIDSKIDQVMAVKTKMAKEGSKHRQSVRNLLTEDQKVFFDAQPGRGQRKHSGPKGNGKGACPYK